MSMIAQIREGFEVETESYEVPTTLRKLCGESLLSVSICDMFLNHGSTICMIMQALNVTRTQVVTTLIAEGILKDRRKNRHPAPFSSD